MKQIVAFIDIKDGKISSRSLQIIQFIYAIQAAKGSELPVKLLTFDSVDNLQIPALSNAQLFEIQGIGETGILSRLQIEKLVYHISSESDVCIIAYKSNLTDAILSTTAVKLNIKAVPQVVSIQIDSDKFAIRQSIFSGKAFTDLHLSQSCILQLNPAFEYNSSSDGFVDLKSQKLLVEGEGAFNVKAINKIAQGANLADASFVVGAGRGLKDPSNWGMIENLADKIGAATACSKPVSDINWRPHSEHVGQTGIKIAPKLYIACGISGAIQHLAGVNSSKTIIVINNDPEAPFFKYADYGIVGDVFDVVPEIVKNI